MSGMLGELIVETMVPAFVDVVKFGDTYVAPFADRKDYYMALIDLTESLDKSVYIRSIESVDPAWHEALVEKGYITEEDNDE